MNKHASLQSGAGERAFRLRTDTLADSVVILLTITVVQRTVGFGRGVLFCRWLDPAALGQWDMVYSFVLLAAPFAVLGLPGSFGRYLQYYGLRGQLRTFLRRTALWTAILGSAAVAAVVVGRSWFSTLIFGHGELTTLVALAAFTLGAVIFHHFLESLFKSLRMYRVVSGMQLCQSIGFAVLSLTLLWHWKSAAISILIAYGAASLVSATASLLWLRGALADVPQVEPPVAQRPFWAKLLRFAAWVWVANLLANLFTVVDRYMIIHYGGMDPGQALTEIGYYHSSRILPLLLLAVAELIGTMLTPYLSHDWESGRRDLVSTRLNLAIKLIALGLLAAGVGVLVSAPLLFGVAFGGKYALGLAVLPWTLTYCVWFGIILVAQNYLWCAEKARLGSLALAVGLIANVGLNLVLLPRYGLLGAVLGTTGGNLAALLLTFLFIRMAGMRIDPGTWILCAAPMALGFGCWPAFVVLAGVVACCLTGDRLLSREEKQGLVDLVDQYVQRVKSLRHGRVRPV